MITREELEKWKQLAEAATAGPWEATLLNIDTDSTYVEPCEFHFCGMTDYPVDPIIQEQVHRDAEFIAAARDAVPRLVAEVERLTGARVPELLRQIYEQREEILKAFVAGPTSASRSSSARRTVRSIG
jgi:hypothetical protein